MLNATVEATAKNVDSEIEAILDDLEMNVTSVGEPTAIEYEGVNPEGEGTATGLTTESTDRLSDTAKKYLVLLQKKENLEKEIEKIKTELMDEIGVGNSYSYKDTKFTVTEAKTQARFDQKTFRKENNDLYEQYKMVVNYAPNLKVSGNKLP